MIKTNKDDISRHANGIEGDTAQTKVKSVYKNCDDDDIKANKVYMKLHGIKMPIFY